SYHFHFGDEKGTPGTILTFFPWGNEVPKGRRGARQVSEVGYSVPEGSLEFWKNRFEENNIIFNNVFRKYGESYLTFLDRDGLKLELTVPAVVDNRIGWTTPEVDASKALKGFHHATITTNDIEPTAKILTEVFGYRLLKQEINRYRFVTNAVTDANIIDLVEA